MPVEIRRGEGADLILATENSSPSPFLGVHAVVSCGDAPSRTTYSRAPMPRHTEISMKIQPMY
ncbi:MAG: hypothetical protein QXI70_00340, partial [Methanothrix sp.]